MAITSLPTPPSRSDPENFAEKADVFMAALPRFADETNALQADVTQSALNADNDATAAAMSANAANESRAAAASLADAAASSQQGAGQKAAESSDSAALARQWATKVGESVDAGEFSAKHHAAVARDWAVKTGAPIADGEFSAKHYAQLAGSLAGLRTFPAIPTSDQGGPVLVQPHGILYWDSAVGRYISAECAETRYFSRTTPPPGYIAEDGALLNISDFPALFARIGTMYGGNGTTNFRAPEGRGEFIRGADMGRGIDPARVVGSAQDATSILAAPGASTTGSPVVLSPSNADSTTNGGSPALAASSGGGTPVSRFTTRPRNVARLACVKYQ